jgi:hypothetical protein
MWRENLFSNLLVLFIITSLFVIIYCKIKDVTLMELIKDIREGLR